MTPKELEERLELLMALYAAQGFYLVAVLMQAYGVDTRALISVN